MACETSSLDSNADWGSWLPSGGLETVWTLAAQSQPWALSLIAAVAARIAAIHCVREAERSLTEPVQAVERALKAETRTHSHFEKI